MGNTDVNPLGSSQFSLHQEIRQQWIREQSEYEREHGYVNTGEVLRLVIDHAQFAWLHNISEFVVRIDETLTAKEPVTPEYTSGAIALARKMFVPTESGDAFQKKYFDAIQRDPAVFIEHAELARLFNNEPPASSTPYISEFPARLSHFARYSTA